MMVIAATVQFIQIDRECTVFRLSTLNDKKERNNVDAFTLHILLLKSTNDNWNVLITYGNCFLHDKCIINTIVLIIDTSVLALLSKLLINHYKFVSRKADDINDNSKTDNDKCTANNNCNTSSTDDSNSNDIDNNNKKCIDCNDDDMNITKNNIRKGINNTTMIASSDDNSIDTSKLGRFMGSVCTQLFCLPLDIESYTVLTTCINGYNKYDTILKALFKFICLILYCIFTIDGEYENLQRARILVDDIILYESNWNRALRLESYLSSSKQINAAKMSQILHVM